MPINITRTYYPISTVILTHLLDGYFQTSAKVLLSGLGADEVFGGYARYNTAAKRSMQALQDEISLDLDRLWERNFGRDDRVISCNGKECRYPFLDKQVIATAGQIPIDFICDFTMHRGMGEKRILRQIAKNMGLDLVQHFEKRAIQFGTKIAKISNKAKFGSNRKANGIAQYT